VPDEEAQGRSELRVRQVNEGVEGGCFPQGQFVKNRHFTYRLLP
jgi:hypothetical protein